MSMYDDLTDDEVNAKIIVFRDAYEAVIGGQVAVIAGNGRRMEYTRADSKALLAIIRELRSLRDERAGGLGTGALGICA